MANVRINYVNFGAMLVNLYKNKTPIALFALPIMIGVMVLPLFFVEKQMPTAIFTWQNHFLNLVLSNVIVYVIASFLVVYLGAIQLNSVVNNFGFYSKNTYLPGFIYALCLLSFNQCSFSMFTVSYLCLIFGLSYLFKINRQDPAGNAIFVSSFFFGIATVGWLFLFPIILLPWFALLIFRSFKWREWLMVLIGASIPWLYHFGIYFFITGNAAIEFESLSFFGEDWELKWSTLTLYIFLAVLFVYGIWRYLIVMNQQLLVFKKRSRILFHFCWLAIVSYILSQFLYDITIVQVLIPLSIVFSVQILYAQRDTFSNLLLYLWIILICVQILF